MGAIDWADPTVAYTDFPGMTTSLNSLASGSTVISTAVNNETDEAMYMDLQLHLGSINISASSNPFVAIRLLESCDGGTIYDDATAGATASGHSAKAPLCIFSLRTGAGAEVKEAVVSMIPIPPGYFKVELKNVTGQTFNATGNTLKYRTYKATVA